MPGGSPEASVSDVPGTEWIDWLERLGTASFGLLAGLALVGSYFGIWLWGRQHREHVAELKASHAADLDELRGRIEKLEESERRWQDMALGLMNPLEQVVTERLARKRG